MRNVNMTQEKRYKYKFTTRVKNEEYLQILNKMINVINNRDIKDIESTFQTFTTFATKGLSSQIRRALVAIEKDILIIKELNNNYDKKLIDKAYKALLSNFEDLKIKLLKIMIPN